MWGAGLSGSGKAWTPESIDEALFDIEDDAQKGAGEKWNPLTTPIVFYHENNVDLFKDSDGILLDQRLSKQGYVHLYINEFASGAWLPRVIAAGIQSLQLRKSMQNLPSAFHELRRLFGDENRRNVDKAVGKLAGTQSIDLTIKMAKVVGNEPSQVIVCRDAVKAFLRCDVTQDLSEETDLAIGVLNDQFNKFTLSGLIEKVREHRRNNKARVHITILSFRSDSHVARLAPYALAALDPSIKILHNSGALTGPMTQQSYEAAIKESIAQHNEAPLFYSHPSPPRTVALAINELANASQSIHADALAKALAE
jgi:hypothetical protein